MNFDNDLKQQADELEISFGPGRVDSIELSAQGGADWFPAKEAIEGIDSSNLAVAKARLGLSSESDDSIVKSALLDQLNMFRFSFDAWMDSYGDSEPDGPLMWISDGTSFEDDFHRSAWILAGCGVLQAANLVCKGFDLHKIR